MYCAPTEAHGDPNQDGKERRCPSVTLRRRTPRGSGPRRQRPGDLERSFYIKRSAAARRGWTPGCTGCRARRIEKPPQGCSAVCHARILDLLSTSPEPRMRVERAEQSQGAQAAPYIERQDKVCGAGDGVTLGMTSRGGGETAAAATAGYGAAGIPARGGPQSGSSHDLPRADASMGVAGNACASGAAGARRQPAHIRIMPRRSHARRNRREAGMGELVEYVFEEDKRVARARVHIARTADYGAGTGQAHVRIGKDCERNAREQIIGRVAV